MAHENLTGTITIKGVDNEDMINVFNIKSFDMVSVENVVRVEGTTFETADIHLTYDQARKLADTLYAMIGEDPKPQTKAPNRSAYAHSYGYSGGYAGLTDQARQVLQHIRRAGSISAREAMNDYGITSATLARRVCDIEEAGFSVRRDRKVHPITGKRYTRYALAPVQVAA